MKSKITTEVTIHFPEGDKDIEMEMKKHSDLENCVEGLIIVLNLINGEQITGIFKGINDEDTVIGSLNGKHTLGYKHHYIDSYFEEIIKS